MVKAVPPVRFGATPTRRPCRQRPGAPSPSPHGLWCVSSHCGIGLLISTEDFDHVTCTLKGYFNTGKNWEGPHLRIRNISESNSSTMRKLCPIVCPSQHRLLTPMTCGWLPVQGSVGCALPPPPPPAVSLCPRVLSVLWSHQGDTRTPKWSCQMSPQGGPALSLRPPWVGLAPVRTGRPLPPAAGCDRSHRSPGLGTRTPSRPPGPARLRLLPAPCVGPQVPRAWGPRP